MTTRLILAIIFVSLFTTASIAKGENSEPKEKRKIRFSCILVPPFPILNPVSQSDYEARLSSDERRWIVRMLAHLKENFHDPEKYFSNLSCSFEVNPNGKFHGLVLFSSMLPEKQRIMMAKKILSLPSLPTVTGVKDVDRRIILRFDENAEQSIRFCN